MPRNWLAFTPNGWPIVNISIGTVRVSALVDTGAQVSMISPTLAAAYSLPITGQILVTGVTGARQLAQKTVVENLNLGTLKLGPLDVAIVDMERLRRDLQVILGVNAFVNRKLQFNFNEGRVYLLD